MEPCRNFYRAEDRICHGLSLASDHPSHEWLFQVPCGSFSPHTSLAVDSENQKVPMCRQMLLEMASWAEQSREEEQQCFEKTAYRGRKRKEAQ